MRDKRREGDPRRNRRKPYRPEAHNRVEHRADRVGEWVAVDDRHRRSDAATAAEKPAAVGLIFHLADGFSFGDDHVHRPIWGSPCDRGRRVASSAPRSGNKFRLHEQIGKSRVSRIRCRRRQDDFGVRCQLDLSASCPEIRDRHPAHLRVVLRRNHYQGGSDRAIAPPDLYAIFGKSHFIGVGFDAARLICRRPDLAAGSVAQKKYVPQASRVRSSRHRVTARLRQWLYPEPAVVTITEYRPLERRWTPGVGSCGEVKRRRHRWNEIADVCDRPHLLHPGRVTKTSRGVRSCSSNSVACMHGSA